MVITHTHDDRPTTRHAFSLAVFTVGRAPDNDLVLPQMTIARKHCRFLRREGLVWVEDLGAPNGMFVNGLMLRQSHVLRAGDVVYLHQKNVLTVEDDELTEEHVAEAVARASDPAAPAAALRALSGMLHERVARAVARNPNAPAEVLLALAYAWPAEVAANPLLPLLLIDRPGLFDELGLPGYERLVRQPALPPALLEPAARSPSASTRLAAASNPAAPEPLLRALAADRDTFVARTASEALAARGG